MMYLSHTISVKIIIDKAEWFHGVFKERALLGTFHTVAKLIGLQ